MKSINIHPSLLPEGKGPTPISWTLLRYPESAGVTFHKMTDDYDCGDIILQAPYAITADDNLDTVLAKLELLIPEMLDSLCADFDILYDSAQPQSGGSYWPRISLEDRRLQWRSDCATLRRVIAAAGQFGVVAAIADQLLLVRQVDCIEYAHNLAPGTIFKEDQQCYCIAIKDGICIIHKASISEAVALKKS